MSGMAAETTVSVGAVRRPAISAPGHIGRYGEVSIRLEQVLR
jgi:hypothetical protein